MFSVKEFEQVSAVVNSEGVIVSKIYTRHGDALRYLESWGNQAYSAGCKVQRFNLVPDDIYIYERKV